MKTIVSQCEISIESDLALELCCVEFVKVLC